MATKRKKYHNYIDKKKFTRLAETFKIRFKKLNDHFRYKIYR